jgi:hypothetical protein
MSARGVPPRSATSGRDGEDGVAEEDDAVEVSTVLLLCINHVSLLPTGHRPRRFPHGRYEPRSGSARSGCRPLGMSPQTPQLCVELISHRSLAHDSTTRPGTRANSRTLAVTIVSPCARHVAASHRSCGPMRRPSAISPAQSCARARAMARSTGSSGKRSSAASTNAARERLRL